MSKAWTFWIVFTLLLALRFWHFDNEIDNPHQWRQCDTANYIWAFYEGNIDLLHPSVCWMGGHKTVIFEFPIFEAIIAVFYKLFGPEHHWARLISLLFFAGSGFFLFKIIDFLFDKKTAQYASLVFLTLPLGLFYSRAIHVDFSAIFFCHGMFYLWLVGLKNNDKFKIWNGALMALLAFLIKAPYAFCFALPLLYWVIPILRNPKRRRELLPYIPAFLLPIIGFIVWEIHVYVVNSTAPDWDFIPHYRKFNNNAHWYFGTLAQRLEIENWKTIATVLFAEVAGFVGLFPFLLGLLVVWKSPQKLMAILWVGGVLLYVLLFFNLNLKHNYYQIPFLAPSALFIGIGLKWIEDNSENENKWIGTLGASIFFVLLLAVNITIAELSYYEKQPFFVETGNIIRQETPKESLVICSVGSFDCRSPHFLYRARRNGWQIERAAYVFKITL